MTPKARDYGKLCYIKNYQKSIFLVGRYKKLSNEVNRCQSTGATLVTNLNNYTRYKNENSKIRHLS